MNATLYVPGQASLTVDTEGLPLPDPTTGFVKVTTKIAEWLDCSPTLVDILDSSPSYVAFSIFDCEEEINFSAMQALSRLSVYPYNSDDEDQVLRGAVLIVIR